MTDYFVGRGTAVRPLRAPAKPSGVSILSAFDYDLPKDPRDLDYESLPPAEREALRQRRGDLQSASRLYWRLVNAAGIDGVQDPENDLDMASAMAARVARTTLEDPKADPARLKNATETVALHASRVSKKREEAEQGLALAHQEPADVYARILAMRRTGLSDRQIDTVLQKGGWDVRKVGAERLRSIDEYARILEETGDFSGAKRLRLGKLDIVRNGGAPAQTAPEDLRLASIRMAELADYTVPEAFSTAVLAGATATTAAIKRYAGMRPGDDGALSALLGDAQTDEMLAAAGRGASDSAPATAFAGGLAGGFIDPVLGILNFIPGGLPATAAMRGRFLATLIARGTAPRVAAAAAERLTLEGVAREAAAQWFIKKGVLSEARAQVMGGLMVNAVQNAAFGAGIGAFQAGSFEGADATDVLLGGLRGSAEGAAFGVALEGAFKGLARVSDAIGGNLAPDAAAFMDSIGEGARRDPAFAEFALPKVAALAAEFRRQASIKGGRLDLDDARGVAETMGFALDDLGQGVRPAREEQGGGTARRLAREAEEAAKRGETPEAKTLRLAAGGTEGVPIEKGASTSGSERVSTAEGVRPADEEGSLGGSADDNRGAVSVEAGVESVPGEKSRVDQNARSVAGVVHEFSSTQVDLPEQVAQKVRALAATIPDSALAADGREARPHVTVKYGLHTDDAAEVRALLSKEGPIEVTLGKASLFPPNKPGGDGAEVVKIDVEGPALRALNSKIAAALPSTDTHPEYRPHVTLAYVKPGEGKKLLKNLDALKGTKITIGEIVFTNTKGQETVIPLGDSAVRPAGAEHAEEARGEAVEQAAADPSEVALPVKDGRSAHGEKDSGRVQTVKPGKAAAAEPVTIDTIKPGQVVTLYRGEGANQVKGGEWWTSNKARAEKYGEVRSIAVTSDALLKRASRTSGAKDEFFIQGGEGAFDGPERVEGAGGRAVEQPGARAPDEPEAIGAKTGKAAGGDEPARPPVQGAAEKAEEFEYVTEEATAESLGLPDKMAEAVPESGAVLEENASGGYDLVFERPVTLPEGGKLKAAGWVRDRAEKGRYFYEKKKPSSGGGGKTSALRPPPVESLERPAASRTPPKVPPDGADFPGPKMAQPKGTDAIPLPPGAHDATGWRPDITPHAGPADGSFEGLPAIRPTPIPEMMALAEGLMGQRPFLAALRGNKGGDFLPLGKGRIRISVKDASNPVAIARTLSHEIGHLIDYLPEQTMARGNVLGRVLSTTQKWVRNEASAIIERLQENGREIGVEGPSIAEATNKELRDELLGLTRWWHPYDPASVPAGYKSYRASGKELFAEGLSVFLNSPGDLKARAPKFYNELVIHLNRKPEVLDGLMAVQGMLNGDPAALAVARQARAEIGTKKAEDRLREAEIARQTDSQSFVSYLGTLLLDAQGPVLDKSRQALAAGIPLDMEEGAFMAMDDWRYQDNAMKVTMDRVKAEVDDPLRTAGIPRADADAYLMNARIAQGDRSEMANPGGLTRADAEFALSELAKRLGPEKQAVLEKAVSKFREIAFGLNEEALKAGVISRKNFDEKVVPNKDTYAPFWVLDYVHRGMSAGIKSQVGTFKDIASPFTAMLHKMVAVSRATEANKAKQAVLVDLIGKHFPGEIKWHEPVHGEDGRVVSAPPIADPGKELVHLYRDGAIVHAEVDPYLARVFMDRDIGQLTRLARLSGLTTYSVFHPLYVTYNQGFALRNVARDFGELHRNSAALKGQVVRKGGPQEKTLKGSNPIAEVMAFSTIFGFKPEYLLERAPTFLEVLTETARAIPESVRKATGRGKTQTIDAMLKERGIDTRYLYESYRHSDIDLESADRVLARSGLRPDDLVEAADKQAGLLRMVHGTLNFLPAVSENLSKVAAFHLLSDRGITGKRRAYFTRNFTGTPSLRKGGHAVQASNGLLMYSKAQVEGFARGARLAAGKDPIFPSSAGGWWARMMLTGVLPKVTMRAAAVGAFGALAKAWIDNIPESDKMHGACIPVPPFFRKNAKGEMESRYLFIPHDYSTRFLMAPLWQALRGEPGRAVAKVVGELPSLGTPFEIARAWGQYAGTGNAYDAFRGRMVLNRDEEAAGGWDAVKGMGAWTWHQTGVLSSTGRLLADPSTAISNPLDAALRHSARGMDEEMYRQADLADAEDARFRLGLPPAVKPLLTERYRLHHFKSGGLEITAEQAARLAALDAWYRVSYLPLTKRMKAMKEAGHETALEEIRKSLDERSRDAGNEGPR